MTLFGYSFQCIAILLILYCPVRSDVNEVKTINDELNENKIKGTQDGGVYIQKGNVGKKSHYRNSIAVRIVNGNVTGIHSHPYLAAFIMNTGVIYCEGTIISSEFILTAAHCLANDSTGELFTRDDRSVYLGIHNQVTWKNGKEFKIKEVFIHENFSNVGFGGYYHHDIGLVKVNQIDYNNFIQKICLADKDTNVIDSITLGTIQGWGDISLNGSTPDRTMKTTLTILGGHACSNRYPSQLPDFDTVVCGADNMRTPVSGPCKGDSGAPFFIKKAGGIKVQIGITSYGRDCGLTYIPSVFTRVSQFLPWIFTHVPRSTVCVMDT